MQGSLLFVLLDMKLVRYGNDDAGIMLVEPDPPEPEVTEFALDDAEAREEAKPRITFVKLPPVEAAGCDAIEIGSAITRVRDGAVWDEGAEVWCVPGEGLIPQQNWSLGI